MSVCLYMFGMWLVSLLGYAHACGVSVCVIFCHRRCDDNVGTRATAAQGAKCRRSDGGTTTTTTTTTAVLVQYIEGGWAARFHARSTHALRFGPHIPPIHLSTQHTHTNIIYTDINTFAHISCPAEKERKKKKQHTEACTSRKTRYIYVKRSGTTPGPGELVTRCDESYDKS